MPVYIIVCMIVTYSKSKDQPVKVPIPARGQLNRENGFPVPVRAGEFGLARQFRPSHPALACSFSILRLNLVLTYVIPPDFRGGVHLYIQSARRHRVSSEVIGPYAIAYRWRSLPIVRRHRASKPQGSSSNGCCLCITMKQLICASLFHTHYGGRLETRLFQLCPEQGLNFCISFFPNFPNHYSS